MEALMSWTSERMLSFLVLAALFTEGWAFLGAIPSVIDPLAPRFPPLPSRSPARLAPPLCGQRAGASLLFACAGSGSVGAGARGDNGFGKARGYGNPRLKQVLQDRLNSLPLKATPVAEAPGLTTGEMTNEHRKSLEDTVLKAAGTQKKVNTGRKGSKRRRRGGRGFQPAEKRPDRPKQAPVPAGHQSQTPKLQQQKSQADVETAQISQLRARNETADGKLVVEPGQQEDANTSSLAVEKAKQVTDGNSERQACVNASLQSAGTVTLTQGSSLRDRIQAQKAYLKRLDESLHEQRLEAEKIAAERIQQSRLEAQRIAEETEERLRDHQARARLERAKQMQQRAVEQKWEEERRLEREKEEAIRARAEQLQAERLEAEEAKQRKIAELRRNLEIANKLAAEAAEKRARAEEQRRQVEAEAEKARQELLQWRFEMANKVAQQKAEERFQKMERERLKREAEEAENRAKLEAELEAERRKAAEEAEARKAEEEREAKEAQAVKDVRRQYEKDLAELKARRRASERALERNKKRAMQVSEQAAARQSERRLKWGEAEKVLWEAKVLMAGRKLSSDERNQHSEQLRQNFAQMLHKEKSAEEAVVNATKQKNMAQAEALEKDSAYERAQNQRQEFLTRNPEYLSSKPSIFTFQEANPKPKAAEIRDLSAESMPASKEAEQTSETRRGAESAVKPEEVETELASETNKMEEITTVEPEETEQLVPPQSAPACADFTELAHAATGAPQDNQEHNDEIDEIEKERQLAREYAARRAKEIAEEATRRLEEELTARRTKRQ